jgi:hypothetical protein
MGSVYITWWVIVEKAFKIEKELKEAGDFRWTSS